MQVLRRHYGKEADIWSCGVMLYILLCGVPPFWGETEHQIFDAILKGRLDFDTDPWPAISTEAKECVKAMLQPVRSRIRTLLPGKRLPPCSTARIATGREVQVLF